MFDRTRRKKSDVIFRTIYRIIFDRFKDIIDRNCVQTFSTNFVEKKQSVVKARTLLQRFDYTVGA